MRQDKQAAGRPGHAEFDDYVAAGYSDAIDTAIAHTGKPQEYFIRFKVRLLLECLAAYGALPVARLLDVGCGNGLWHRWLEATSIARLYGVDPSIESLRAARRANPRPGYIAVGEQTLPLIDGAVDVALLALVLHHVEPGVRRSLMDEVSRVLTPRGLAIIFEHNPYNPLTRRLVNTCPFDANASMITPGASRRLLRQSGFVDIRTRCFLFSPFESEFFTRLDRRLGWLPMGAQYVTIGVAPDHGGDPANSRGRQ